MCTKATPKAKKKTDFVDEIIIIICTAVKNDGFFSAAADIVVRYVRRTFWTPTARRRWCTCATRPAAEAATMLAGALDRVLPGRRSPYLHRVNVERRPRPPVPPQHHRPYSYHGGATADCQRRDGLRTSGRKLAAKFWSSCGSSRSSAVVSGSVPPDPVAVRKRAAATAAATTTCSNGGFSNVSHTWRFKRLRYDDDTRPIHITIIVHIFYYCSYVVSFS